MLRSSDTPRNVCLCRYHENVKLALDCLQHASQGRYSRAHRILLKLWPAIQIVPSACAECMNGKLLEMRTLCNIPEDDKQIKVTWYTWETTEGLPNKVQKSGTLGDVL